ncbi:hypothetical protein EIN_225540 [Entamoeba invadens IP1]|uniref:Uncharacterized protein n=2 Tax=Entamoeba invadens TaxID=33085 RepID=A0A0A1U2D0_ENTIV|nr:hypothetical protein EIN_225540 [Entamoeba invadens IP1]BAN40200.1 hypothetical protein [Entamoeba invadens]ELP88231.1 hypothetical protein EIN_225540 [Entamoeba invadens IP1]BAN40408.1 hypothetical protein [Entamoeba invadens]BAN40943.1 hypothetical protein [Entamoeba invadens]BAN41092.1 hypothetical protein [Entamoeba invadens]|eukprot:XP_004255002.1 hypothetical protein EIN_225540 [Entamoeba invadens IP1]
MQTSEMTQYCNARKFPVFDPVDSTPVSEENEPYHLKLCFCPLCTKGMTVLSKERSRNVISWQYICRVIFYCLSVVHKKNGYFSLKYDVHWFIVDHWYLFSQLEQFRTNPNKWKKAILDAMIHCSLFESGKSTMNKTGVWKLRKYEAPWEVAENSTDDVQKMSMECSQEENTTGMDLEQDKKLALPSLSSLYKYANNDMSMCGSTPIPLPSLVKGLSENFQLEDFNGFIQSIV